MPLIADRIAISNPVRRGWRAIFLQGTTTISTRPVMTTSSPHIRLRVRMTSARMLK
jgi:hypothetical protein